MNIFAHIRQEIIFQLQQLVNEGRLPQECNFDAIVVELPKDRAHGDMATNAALVLAKPAKQSPHALASLITEKIETIEDIDSTEIAGPGFINLRLTPHRWQLLLKDILEEGVGYGSSTLGQGETINLEFVSANPTGPLHIGHARGAVFGDSIANLLIKAGYLVTREFYINDAGAQVEVLARSAYLRYKEALGEDIGAIPEGYYPGEYLVSVGKALVDRYGDALLQQSEEEWLPQVRNFAVEAMMVLIQSDLENLGVEHDIFTSESRLHKDNKIQEVINILTDKGLVYTGVLEPPKGKKPDDWEERPQLLFKATEFGDDVDRPLQKSDGSWTYFAADIAYHLDKYQRGFNHMILELGIDHGGYLKRMKAAVAAISDGKAKIDIKFHQLVNFLENGKPAKMSKRAGSYVTVWDVVNRVGKDILRFVMLTRSNDMVLDFDLEKVKEQSKDNPVFYVQYAHARCSSILRNAKEEIADIEDQLKAVDEDILGHLNHSAELALIRQLAFWPRLVESAAQQLEPHRVAYFLQDLAAEFHGLWNKGKEDASLRFIVADNPGLTVARLALVQSVADVIASGLEIFNVKPVEEM